MKGLRMLSLALDRFSDLWGAIVTVLILAMVAFGSYNAVARYVGRFVGLNLSSNVYLELQWYLFSLIFLLGAGWALRRDAHVRVDVLYSAVSKKAQRRINLIGTFLLLIPFSVFVLWTSIQYVQNSFAAREMSPDPGGLPRYPLKAVIPLCFILLLLQGVSEAIKLFSTEEVEPRSKAEAAE
ncbi:MAG: TRAP transporter small permease subunit [Gemmatimonadota bacterium]|nr:TRAP transporter small permease subunit [Gemmatimonadota bacterium]